MPASYASKLCRQTMPANLQTLAAAAIVHMSPTDRLDDDFIMSSSNLKSR